ncbi:MAG: tRNA pseudouridine(55) synthase TruB [Endomicrobiales bacterium]|nr:tRNA pseudouridine(55) synthase TruB [Endomicrobiales bacterium]
MTELAGGLLNINKRKGVTSFWVVKQVRRILGAKKVGHCGTLDPMAEGVLLVLFGRATKLQAKYMSCEKVYRARITLGVETDSGDITGKTVRKKEIPPFKTEDIENALRCFEGEIEQVPPMYSALKVNGKKLYELARKGVSVERLPRKVIVHGIELLGFDGGSIDLRIRCSKGTYIRTLAVDIGEKLGCGATVSELCREKVGDFCVATAFDGAMLKGATAPELFRKVIAAGDVQVRN